MHFVKFTPTSSNGSLSLKHWRDRDVFPLLCLKWPFASSKSKLSQKNAKFQLNVYLNSYLLLDLFLIDLGSVLLSLIEWWNERKPCIWFPRFPFRLASFNPIFFLFNLHDYSSCMHRGSQIYMEFNDDFYIVFSPYRIIL